MAIKKVLLSKKIDNVIHNIFPKTSADIVVYGESTVAEALASFAIELSNVYTSTQADAAIKASADALYNKIMGITEEDGATVTEAYDTLKEVAAWIDEHGEAATAFSTDITALKTAIGTVESGLVKDVSDNKTEIANLKTIVGDENSGLVKQVSDLSTGSGNHIEASETNGNVKIDGAEVTVYTHPETHSASIIEETDDRKFVTANEKTAIANAAAVTIVSTQDEVVNENDLYLVEITQ